MDVYKTTIFKTLELDPIFLKVKDRFLYHLLYYKFTLGLAWTGGWAVEGF